MTFTTIVLVGWVCDSCGVEVLHQGEDFPDGWSCTGDGETHRCGVCWASLS